MVVWVRSLVVVVVVEVEVEVVVVVVVVVEVVVVVVVVIVVVFVIEWVPLCQMKKMSWKRRNLKKGRSSDGLPLTVGNVQPRVQHQSVEELAWVFELRRVQTVVLIWVILQVVVHLLACVGPFFVQPELERHLSQHIEIRACCSG